MNETEKSTKEQYNCPACGATFRSKEALEEHYRQVHTNSSETIGTGGGQHS
jgi:uncharacterized C2H2 Zn-finger protein